LKSVAAERIQYELKKIVTGQEALKVVKYLDKIKIFDWMQSYKNTPSNSLLSVNYDNFSQEEFKRYLPIFYLKELLQDSTAKKLKFCKSDILNLKYLRRWSDKLKFKSIKDFSENERFDLHKDLENILPAFILYLPIEQHNYWLTRWRNKKDKLFHPRNFINGNTLKKFVAIDDGPLLGDLLNYLSKEFAYERLGNLDEAIYKAKLWIQQNAPKCD